MRIELPDLPYPLDALEPFISARTLSIHHGKHHRAYVDRTNALIGENPASLEEIIASAAGNPAKKVLFNNAAQVWNHTFYWSCMAPGGGGAPTQELGEKINSAFGSYDEFRKQFSEAAATQFGSGWAWLIETNNGLGIMKTANADNPLKHGEKALLTIDVWEHAYYIDYRNARPKYIETFLDSLLNWDFVAENLSS